VSSGRGFRALGFPFLSDEIVGLDPAVVPVMLHLRTQKLTETIHADITPDVAPAWNKKPHGEKKKNYKCHRILNPQSHLLATEGGKLLVAGGVATRSWTQPAPRPLLVAGAVSAPSCWTTTGVCAANSCTARRQGASPRRAAGRKGGCAGCVGPQAVSHDFLDRMRRPR
jgi:hypothetical protein